MRASTGQVRGTVRVTTSAGIGQVVIVPSLRAPHELHPGLQVDLLLTDAVVDLVAGHMDVALRLGPPADSSLVGQRLTPMRYRVCASPAYVKAHGRPRTPADLSHCDCLRFSQTDCRTQWKFRRADEKGELESVDVGGWLVLSSALALHRAALDGLGPALLADLLVRQDIASGHLVDLFPDHEVTATNFDSALWVLYASRSYVPRRVRAFVDFVKQRFQDPRRGPVL